MKILVSKCLLGVSCRWHGKKLYKSGFIRKFLETHPNTELIEVCPEELAGLPTPRPPVKRKNGRVYTTCEDKAERKNITIKDVTEAFMEGARQTLAIAKKNNCQQAVLCKWSPSCDRTGITGKLLVENGIKIINTF